MAAIIMAFREPSSADVVLTRLIMTVIEGPFHKRYVESMGLKGDERVLEFGPGPGKMSRYLASALPNGHLTIVDLSRVWLGIVRKKMERYENVELKQGKVMALPIVDGSFDVIVASFVIHDVDVEERQKVVDTLAAKLRTGGRVYVRDPEAKNGRSHGMSGQEMREVMVKAGLKEISFERKKPFYMGPLNQGIYKKE
jgi:ubiquinone/menaquinone biosynthesis C-methylase UbiE